MPPKAKNAYSFFLADFRKSIPGLAGDINDLAFPRWQGLSADERGRYERMAKDYKAKRKQTNAGRHDNQGNLLANRQDPREAHLRRTNEEKNGITLLVKQQNDVLDMPIYLVHFTTFCVTQEGKILLAELGAVEYSLRHGIKRTFHAFFKPLEIPMGYRFAVQKQAESVLQIPLINFDLATDNFKKVWDDLKAFTAPGRRDLPWPPLFCLGEDVEMVGACLQRLGELVGNIDASLLYTRVWSLEALVGELYLCKLPTPRSELQILTFLKSSSWDDKQDARCDYHRDLDGALCALASCKKYCYAMSDMLAVVFNIELTQKHLPMESAHPCAFVIEPLQPQTPTQTPAKRQYASPILPQAPSEGWHVDPNPPRGVSQDEVFYSDDEDEEIVEEEDEPQQPAVRLPKAPARSQTMGTGAMVAQDWPSLQNIQAPPSTRAKFVTAQPPSAQERGTNFQAAAAPAPSTSNGALHRNNGAPLPRGRGSLLQTQTPSNPPPGFQSQVETPMAGLGRGLVLEGNWPSLPSAAPRVVGLPGAPSLSPTTVQTPPPAQHTPLQPPLCNPAVGSIPQQAGVGRGYLNGGPVPARPVGRGAMPPGLKARSAAGLPGAMRNLSFN